MEEEYKRGRERMMTKVRIEYQWTRMEEEPRIGSIEKLKPSG